VAAFPKPGTNFLFQIYSQTAWRFAMRIVKIITLLMVIIGGLNWGLVGILEVDFVTTILGNGSAETATGSTAARIVYYLVALSAVHQIGCLVRLLTGDEAVVYRGGNRSTELRSR
jgi:uncharacterized protein